MMMVSLKTLITMPEREKERKGFVVVVVVVMVEW